jgi:hypothetical protein
VPQATPSPKTRRFRPQFSTRALFICIAIIFAPVAWISGEIYRAKSRGNSYRNAITAIHGSGVGVVPMREQPTDAGIRGLIESYIDPDSSDQSSVKITLNADLTDQDLAQLQKFKRVHTVELVAAEVTDSTLRKLTSLKALSNLLIREGNYSAEGLNQLSQIRGLESLEVTSQTIEAIALRRIFSEPGLKRAAIRIDHATFPALKLQHIEHQFEELHLVNHDFRNPVPVDEEAIPPTATLSLRSAWIPDGVLRRLANRSDLRIMHLHDCAYDATLAVRLFKTSVTSNDIQDARPRILLHGAVVAQSPLSQQDLDALASQQLITQLTINQLPSLKEIPNSLRVNRTLKVLKLSLDLPLSELFTLAKENPELAIGVLVDPVPSAFQVPQEIAAAKNPISREMLTEDFAQYTRLRYALEAVLPMGPQSNAPPTIAP